MRLLNAHSEAGEDQQKTDLTEPLWTVEDVANYLRLKQETVRMMARANKLPALKVGKVWRFRAIEIKEMMKSKMNY